MAPVSFARVAAAALVPALLGLSACSSDEAEVDLAELTDAQASSCAEFIDALPDSLLGLDLDDSDDRVARYGAVTVACGVPRPADYAPTAPCNEVNGVGWYVPQQQLTDPRRDLTTWALSHEPYVYLAAPGDERVDGMDAALFDLADAMTASLGEGLTCL